MLRNFTSNVVKFRHIPARHTSTSPKIAPKNVFRSRHIDPSQTVGKSDSGLRLLRPHILSSRLTKLCDAEKIDQAVLMLKNSPRDAQNTQVWNTLILECLKAKKYNLSYKLYTDMKRRSFSPSVRTFQTMFTGLSKIKNWASHTKQLGHAHAIYDVFLRYMDSVKKQDPNSPELSSAPLAGYLKILGDNNLYQRIFDVYYALPSDGPMAPDHLVYTAIFQALALTANAPPTALSFHNAANAKLIWSQMIKASQKGSSPIVDTRVVTSAVAALSQGQSTEVNLAFQIIRDHFGLGTPGDPPSQGGLPLSTQALNVILRLCNTTDKRALCIHFFEEVKRRPAARGGIQILDHWHLDEVLRAYIAFPKPGAGHYCVETLEWMLRQEVQSGPKIKPSTTSYNIALTACHRAKDWKSAARIFHLMTGVPSRNFLDGSVSLILNSDRRTVVEPTAEVLNLLVETSLASYSHANVRQSLRMVEFLKVGMLFEKADPGKVKNSMLFTLKLASSVAEAVRYVSSTTNKGLREAKQWQQLADMATQLMTRIQNLIQDSTGTGKALEK